MKPNRLTAIGNGLRCLKGTLAELYMQENAITKIEGVDELVPTIIMKTGLTILDISYNKVEQLTGISTLPLLEALYLNSNCIENFSDLEVLKDNPKLTTVRAPLMQIALGGNPVSKFPGYRMKLQEILPLIDDIDGVPTKTTYNVVFGDKK